MTHPVRFHTAPLEGGRDRLLALLRPILAIPHALLVGGPVLGVLGGGYRAGGFGAVALVIALIDWFSVLLTGKTAVGLEPYKRLYLRWRARLLAYATFLRDEYPPFGEGDYPAELELPPPAETRDRAKVLLRPVFILPHLVVLLVVMVLLGLAGLASWVLLVVTGRMPDGLWRFTRDAVGYSLRVEAYGLLMHDEFPAFALHDDVSDFVAREISA